MNLEPWIEFDKRRGTHQVRWRDASGIKKRDEFAFRDKARATERKKQVWDLLERKALGHVDDTRSPAACVEAYLGSKVGQISEVRLKRCCRYGLKSFIDAVDLSSMRDITRVKLLEYKDILHKKGYSDQTIASYLGVVRAWLKWAKDMEWINGTPFMDIGISTPKQIDRFFTDAEIIDIEKAIDNPEFRCIFRLGYMVGLRPAEILRIRSEHFLFVETSKRWVLVIPPDETKTSEGRSVAVPDMIMDLLPKKKGLIFSDWTEQRKNRHFMKAKIDAKIEDRFLKNGRRIVKIFYWTRHTFARRFLERGGRLNVLQVLMGHSSFKITNDTYGHLEKSYVLDQAHAMNDVSGYLETEVCGAGAGQNSENRDTLGHTQTQWDTNSKIGSKRFVVDKT